MSAAPQDPTDTQHPPCPDAITPTSQASDLPCHEVDPELFFAEQPELVEAAKSLCAQCPVRSACLQAAIERREPWGVWGGQLIDHGVVVPRKKPRGRPRKADLMVDEQLRAQLRSSGLPVRAGTAA